MINDNIQMFQIKLNLTNREAAKYFGCCSERTWSNWISGTCSPPANFVFKMSEWCDMYNKYMQKVKFDIGVMLTRGVTIELQSYRDFESYIANGGKDYITYKIEKAVIASLFDTKIMKIKYI